MRMQMPHRANFYKLTTACLISATCVMLTVACSAAEPAKINPVTGGTAAAIAHKQPSSDDQEIYINGKKWDGSSDMDSSRFHVVGN